MNRENEAAQECLKTKAAAVIKDVRENSSLHKDDTYIIKYQVCRKEGRERNIRER